MMTSPVTQDYGPVNLDSVDALTLNWNQIQWLVPVITVIVIVVIIIVFIISITIIIIVVINVLVARVCIALGKCGRKSCVAGNQAPILVATPPLLN